MNLMIKINESWIAMGAFRYIPHSLTDLTLITTRLSLALIPTCQIPKFSNMTDSNHLSNEPRNLRFHTFLETSLGNFQWKRSKLLLIVPMYK